MRPRIVIVGAGAAGVFTAYRVRKMYGDEFEVVLLEKNGRVGGNTYSTDVEYGGRTYNIDCGAQFFWRYPQASYTQLVEDLGLFDERLITSKPVGITIWDEPTDRRVFFVPACLGGFGKYDRDDWERIVEFGIFLGYALALDRNASPDYELGVERWLGGLGLLSEDFRQRIVKSFLYQFVALPGNRIDESSALYAITYFVRNVFGEARVDEPDPTVQDMSGLATPPRLRLRMRGLPVFKTYQSRIGLDGIMKRALAAVAVVPELGREVLMVQKQGPGAVRPWLVTTNPGPGLEADYVVMACDPQWSATALAAGGWTEHNLIDSLRAIEYSKLRISLQRDGSCHMPTDETYWQPVNTLVDGDRLTFSAWFGPLRGPYDGNKQIPVFKSWASPGLDPATCAHEFLAEEHSILLPTTKSMAARERVMARSTRDGLFFAGGWTNWFDSQEAALASATRVAEALPPRARASAGRARMVEVDTGRMRDNLQHWLNDVSPQAPEEHKRRIVDAFRKVEHEG
jgi:predicted NAD/FAD-binding protein